MRENIGQYIDACAELGMNQRELFTADDLFEDKNMRAVLKNVEGLSRVAQVHAPHASATPPLQSWTVARAVHNAPTL